MKTWCPTRRSLLAVATLSAAFRHTSSTMAQPAFPRRLLYSNDTTNILTCVSPYHAVGAAFSEAMLESSVDEAAEADIQLLQPGLGWVPLWRSASYPVDEHLAWFAARTGIPPERVPNTLLRYMHNGGDVLGAFVTRCRTIGVSPYASIRLNDAHSLDLADENNGLAAWVSRFWVDHPEYRIGSNLQVWKDRVHNWMIPEVRLHKMNFLQEICSGYDIDGLELDFMRIDSFFRLQETSKSERSAVMVDVCAEARSALDRTAKPGARRTLCVRVPAILEAHAAIGVDVGAFAEAGVDIFTLSNSFYTSQRHDLPAFRRRAPAARLHLEMTHTSGNFPDLAEHSQPRFFRATDTQLRTTALDAYAAGADGIALFNFAYFRQQSVEDRSPGVEPPFYLLPELRDPVKLQAHRERWWFISKSWGVGPRRSDSLPRRLIPHVNLIFSLTIASLSGDDSDSILRVRTTESSEFRMISSQIGNTVLTRTSFEHRPIEHPYSIGIGNPSQFQCFIIPAGAIIRGVNIVSILLLDGDPLTVEGIDLIVK